MNKKAIIAIVAVIAVVAVAVAAVVLLGGDKTPKADILDSADVINQVVDTYAEDEKFMAMGGDASAPVDGKAGKLNLSDTETVNSLIHASTDVIADVDEASSFVHAMNANTFTAASFKLKEGVDATTFSNNLKTGVLSTQWMCGFPEKIIIATVNGGEYVVYAIGATDLVSNFNSKLQAKYGESVVIVTDEAVE